MDILEEVKEYFEERADAEYFTDSAGGVPNEEMRMLGIVQEAAQEIERLRNENNKANGLLKIVHEWLMPLAKNKGYISANDRNNALSVMVDIRMHLEND